MHCQCQCHYHYHSLINASSENLWWQRHSCRHPAPCCCHQQPRPQLPAPRVHQVQATATKRKSPKRVAQSAKDMFTLASECPEVELCMAAPGSVPKWFCCRSGQIVQAAVLHLSQISEFLLNPAQSTLVKKFNCQTAACPRNFARNGPSAFRTTVKTRNATTKLRLWKTCLTAVLSA